MRIVPVDLPRRRYFLDIPLFLLSVGFLAWVIPTDMMLAVASAVGTGAGLYFLVDLVVKRAPIRFSLCICIALTMGYGLGTLNSWLTLPRGSIELAVAFGRDTEAVVQAMAAVLIASAVLLFLGELYEPVTFNSRYKLKLDNRVVTFILVGTGILVGAYVSGLMGYMGGTGATGGGGRSIFLSLIFWLIPTVFAVTAVAFFDRPKDNVKWLLGGLLVLQFLLLVPVGRRTMLYCILLAAIATRFSSFQPRWSNARKFVYAAIVGSLIAVGATAFFYLRVAGNNAHRNNLALSERIQLALDLYQKGSSGKVNGQIAENLQKRTFVIGYLSDLLAASQHMQPAMGADAFHEFQLVVPAAFWEDKSAFLYEEESVANMQFNFAFRDMPNSTVTAGALDFGFWGIIFYPIVLCVIYRVLVEIFRIHLDGMALTFVTLALLFDSLVTESGLSGHLANIRNTFIFSFLLWFFFKLPNFGLRRQKMAGGSIQ